MPTSAPPPPPPPHQILNDGKQLGDIVSLGVVAGVAQNWLPAIASLLAIVWSLIRLVEWVRWRIILHKKEPFL